MPRRPQLQQQPRALGRTVDPQLERHAQPLRGGVEVQAGARRPRGEHVVLEGSLHRPERRRGREVMGEVGHAPRPGALERLAHAQMQLRAPHRREAVIERTPHELVREPVLQPTGRQRLDHAGRDRLLQRGRERDLGREAHDLQPELGADGGRDLEQIARPGVQPRDAPGHDLAHALRRAELPAVRERPPQLAHQERVARGQRVDRVGELLRLAPGSTDELLDLVRGEPAEPQPDDVIGAPQVGEGLRQRLRQLLLPERGDHEHAHPAAGPREVPQQPERRRVRPVHVLDHQQDRTLPREAARAGRRRRCGGDDAPCPGPRRRARRAARTAAAPRGARTPRRTGRTADGRPRRTPRTGRGRRARRPRSRTPAPAGSCRTPPRRRRARRAVLRHPPTGPASAASPARSRARRTGIPTAGRAGPATPS